MATIRTRIAATAIATAAAILPAPAAHAGILDTLTSISADTDYHPTTTATTVSTHTIPMSGTITRPTRTTTTNDDTIPLISDTTTTPANPWPSTQYEKLSKDIATIINAHRTRRGEPAMRLDNTMSAAAQSWAAEMAQSHWFEHDPGNHHHGEIIAWRNNIDSPKTAENFVKQWENSPAHARLMHDERFHVMGVGVGNDPTTNQVYAVVRLYYK